MEELLKSLTGMVAIILSLGIPTTVVIMVFLRKMKRDKQEKEIRQLIIENKTDAETARLLIDEPKKTKEPRKLGPVNVDTLRTACILLGMGLGALLSWGIERILSPEESLDTIYFWILIAFGIGIGMLCSFLVEMHLYKKYSKDKPYVQTTDEQ